MSEAVEYFRKGYRAGLEDAEAIVVPQRLREYAATVKRHLALRAVAGKPSKESLDAARREGAAAAWNEALEMLTELWVESNVMNRSGGDTNSRLLASLVMLAQQRAAAAAKIKEG